MDSKHGEVRKIHVVYFLSRGGHIEHPHMIKVHPAVRNGVRLKDVKRWLSNIRGKDMPNSFSWSYKRRYKTGYVWQDLCDNDLITPICDNEYILKGSEILPTNPDTCKCSAKSPTENLLVEELHSKNQSPQASKMLKLDLPNRQTNFEDSQNYSEPESYKGIRYLKDGNSFHHNSDESEDNRPIVEYFTKTSGNSPSKSLNSSGEVVKIYRAVRSSSTGMKLDAATQTGESQRFTSNKQRSPPLSHVQDMEKDSFLQKNASSKAPEELQKSSSYSKLSCMRNDVITSVAENNTKHPSKESRHGKPKAMAASNVLRQLFTCGGLETRDSGIRTVKALTFNRSSSNEENRSHRTVDNFQSSTPLKKPQSQPDLTRSLNFSELPSPEAKSISANSDSKISEARLDRSDHSKRDVNGVQNSSKSSPEDLSSLSRSSLSSGEYAAVKLVDIPTADVKNNKENGSLGLHMPVCEVSTEFSVKASPTSAPKSPATHLDDLNDQTKPLSPATDRKGSRKSKASDALSKGKHNNESYCSQCGRAFKAEYLKAHSKFCRGPKNAIKAKRTVVAK